MMKKIPRSRGFDVVHECCHEIDLKARQQGIVRNLCIFLSTVLVYWGLQLNPNQLGV